MTAKIQQHQIAVVIEMPAIRPKQDEAMTVLNRGALIDLCRELVRIARDQNMQAAKITFGENIIRIQRAARLQ